VHAPPTDDQIQALVAAHGLAVGAVEPSPHEGSVNHVRMVGPWCVRVLKEEDYASDLYTEAVCVPALTAAGVRTPELVAFDQSREIVPGLATIYQRVPGAPLGLSEPLAEIDALVRELGRQIATWRSQLRALEDPNGWLDRPRGDDAWANYERAADRLGSEERAWTERAIRRLEAAPEPAAEFVHWDLHAFNVLTHDGRFSSVIDWGDAGFGDPTLNYRCLPAHWLPLLLETADEGGNFVGRCLYHLLAYALNDVHRAPRYATPYSHTGHRRWESLAALATRPPDAVWRDWLGDAPPKSALRNERGDA